jgi:hypothetical protein
MKKTILFPSDFPTVLPDRGYGLFYVKEMILHADFTKLLILPFLVDISVLSMFG